MYKRVLFFAGIIFLLVLIGYVLYSNLEIYEYKVPTGLSREARTNNYYAMEQWLKQTGHPVRFENTFNPSKLAAAEERVVMLHSIEGQWDNADEFIIPWIEQGGHLIISFNYHYLDISLIDENILNMLFDLGITLEKGNVGEDIFTEKISSYEPESEKPIPNIGSNITFLCDDKNKISVIKDEYGYARLAEVSIGKGTLTVTGFSSFMYNSFIKEEVNANLAWNLTGARANGENSGVLFVRKRNLPNSMLGKIMERGNLLPVGISALLLIVLGFWMVIPIFGLVSVEKQKIARPIRERFLAEIRFLKKYRALDNYLVNEEEKNTGESSEKKAYNYRELINQYRRIFNGTAKF